MAETGIALVSASGLVTPEISGHPTKTQEFKFDEPITVDFVLADGYT